MHISGTNDKPDPLNTGTAAVSLLILAGIAVAVIVMLPVFVVLILILVPAVITTSFLVMGFLASGGLGASGIAFLFWLCKLWKEKPWRYNMYAQEVRPDVANKLAIGKEENLVKVAKRADEPLENDEPSEEDKPPEKYMLLEAVELISEGDLPLGVKQASIPDISKVWLVEQKPIGPKRRGPSTSTKRSHHIRFAMDHTTVRSIFMKEYQKVPRVGASAYKYFTSRDKKYINHIHI